MTFAIKSVALPVWIVRGEANGLAALATVRARGAVEALDLVRREVPEMKARHIEMARLGD